MTILNKRDSAGTFNRSRHYSPGGQVTTPKGKIPAIVAQSGDTHVCLRLRENPHHAEWVRIK